jgi:hypothetical protein
MSTTKITNCLLGSLVCLLLALLVAGCPSREHIRPDYGQRTRGYFARQRVHPQAASDRPKGLDSEESSIIYANYRENLKGEGAVAPREAPSRVLVVEESNKKK